MAHTILVTGATGLRQPESVHAALTGVDRAFLLTPNTPDQVELGTAFVGAAKQAGVKHIVKLSAAGADDKAITLGRWHREVEEVIENSGLAYTFVRPTSFMQNYANFMALSIKTEGAYYLPRGDGRVAQVDVRDVAAVAAAALTEDGHAGQAYTVTGPAAISEPEVADILSRVAGRKVTYVDVSEEAAYNSMIGLGMPEELAKAMVELYRVERAGYASTVSPAVEQVSGRPPRAFAQFAQDYAAAFK